MPAAERGEVALFEDAFAYHLEKRYVHKSGRVVWVLVTQSLVRGASGRPARLLLQVHDLSARRAAEQQPSTAPEVAAEPTVFGVGEMQDASSATSKPALARARELREQHRAQELLFELGERIKNVEESTALIRTACRCLCEQFEAHDCGYGEVNLERTEVTMRVSASGTGL